MRFTLFKSHLENPRPARRAQMPEGWSWQDWGLVDYEEATSRQLELVEQVASGEAISQIIFCRHPEIITLGRAAEPGDSGDWTGKVVNSSRGGRATFHGPNQLVVYPVVSLAAPPFQTFAAKDILAYLRWLASWVERGVNQLGVEKVGSVAEARFGEDQAEDGSKRHLTGIWIGSQKVASVGVAVRKWVTYHGVAINVQPLPRETKRFRPCGFAPETMTSLTEVLGREVMHEEVRRALLNLGR